MIIGGMRRGASWDIRSRDLIAIVDLHLKRRGMSRDLIRRSIDLISAVDQMSYNG